MKKITIITTLVLFSMGEWSCEEVLEVRPPTELDAQVIRTESGAKALLYSSYRGIQNSTPSRWLINAAEVTTDVGTNSGGTEFLMISQLMNFTWDATLGTLQVDFWAPNYRAIRDANLLLENLPSADMPDANRTLFTAEARVLRAYAYESLYKVFGPVPLRTTSDSPTQLDRATDDEMRTFIESELVAAIPDLPDPGKEESFGRVNKGMALSILAKYYLNTRQWQKAADAAASVMAFNYYILFADYTKAFTVANEGNKEMILVIPCLNQEGYGNWYTAGALPPNFKTSTQVPEYVWIPGMANFATQYRLRSALVNSFDLANDKRAVLVLRSYTNIAGATVNLMSTADNGRSLKYWDNATSGNHSGNDVPIIRFADILLTRAEALNELTGPSQEAVDLVNRVRTRAGLTNLTLGIAGSKENFRDLILRERNWEFVAEGKRREDLLRHDRFITMAQARGIATAADKHKLFPIPQVERDANKLCGQNPGY